MRLWTLHPKYLDAKGIVALWRESLLARNVLENKTRGYRNHPQLTRFRNSEDPFASINGYLHIIYLEALQRGYCFDRTKFSIINTLPVIPVTGGQLQYEVNHLLKKLQTRDPGRYEVLNKCIEFMAHPIFKIIAGEAEPWEVINMPGVASPALLKLPVVKSSQ
jgi:hypothetical protein